MKLQQFNQASAAEARTLIAHCVALEDWITALVAQRPYHTVERLLQRSDALARQWEGAVLSQALSAHPRIGERGQGRGKEVQLSAGEQSGVNADDDRLKQALHVGNIAYERRFGRVFLIRAKGRSGEEILAELHRRLDNDAQQEQQEALAQLREITLLRLKETFR
ncbi:2-oxo-4-hydroxy-4-carboxy-5-ureidoimidazoline decarboxylase [Erwinia psidii]|uniref:2-oxo-4-hydroxy-4-carboxy-5-ureidoimidazoline decarboxylase n=1 Tax=Erwinia psidii TaxID=69224 RepID=A0A3N6RWE4_9GAMM|nr:2-oxo-4-hydroxy-4-carboxy-5-ureidoimidazoline decarboxylase [Erwinia psidii]MCX8959241.1 2-oxo-4-hydroxy-4-carboxy-5-ureidoimidazoline decarboxylase [Erwinia psidii]MCX8966018.1 2-oxo-4-hydroxy-4-carboxy-5-ureidoimidazoline decarboxylase [Erwinia psidii]RQM36667.1 2-oxo-4-hydroxy-4-carboxy-5-ureidoimidazoline decarboxylase [Erwinia psidii]